MGGGKEWADLMASRRQSLQDMVPEVGLGRDDKDQSWVSNLGKWVDGGIPP